MCFYPLFVHAFLHDTAFQQYCIIFSTRYAVSFYLLLHVNSLLVKYRNISSCQVKCQLRCSSLYRSNFFLFFLKKSCSDPGGALVTLLFFFAGHFRLQCVIKATVPYQWSKDTVFMFSYWFPSLPVIPCYKE